MFCESKVISIFFTIVLLLHIFFNNDGITDVTDVPKFWNCLFTLKAQYKRGETNHLCTFFLKSNALQT